MDRPHKFNSPGYKVAYNALYGHKSQYAHEKREEKKNKK